MKNRKPFLICVLILGVLLVWLPFSTSILASFAGDVPEKASYMEFESNSNIIYSFDNFHSNSAVEDIFETVRLRGWAFAETLEENEGRIVSLIFKNDSQCYKITIRPAEHKTGMYFNRPDVVKAYPDSDIPSPYVGFYAEFPSFNMGKDVYDVCVHCWENTSNQGMVQTNLQFVKENGTSYFRNWQSTEASLENRPSEETALRALDTITLENDLLTATGWIYQPELDCANQSVYFEINGTAYTALSVARPDVAKGYENELYTMSGYRACIPAEIVPEGESTVRVLVENGGQVYSGAPITVVRTGDTIEKRS